MPRIVDDPADFWAAHAVGEPVGLRTSGTSTGIGRVIVRTTASWLDSFDPLVDAWSLPRGQRWWIGGPMSSTMNVFAAVMATHLGGSWGADPEGATVGQFTPATLHRFLAHDPGSITDAVVAGAGLDPDLRDRARAAGLRVHHYYGAAELSLVAFGTASDDLQVFDQVEVEVRGQVIWARSPWLSLGYLEPDEFAPLRGDERGFLTVGDRGELSGRRLRVLGRDGAVTTAGQTVILAPLEHQLRSVACGDVVLVGAPDPLVGEVLTAVLTDASDIARLRSWSRVELTGADRPRRWVHLAELPLTPVGKVDIRAITKAVSR